MSVRMRAWRALSCGACDKVLDWLGTDDEARPLHRCGGTGRAAPFDVESVLPERPVGAGSGAHVALPAIRATRGTPPHLPLKL